MRFAPSPTGPLHIGGARTALYNWLFARGRSGVFVLRVDDTDRERSTAANLERIVEGLRWLGLDWDEGPEKGGAFAPYFQSQRLAGYAERADALRRAGKAYPCFCTREEVAEGRERMRRETGNPMYDRRCRALSESERGARLAAGDAHTLRFAVPRGSVRVHDEIKGDVAIDLAAIDDWVMLRQDGSPLYNLCSALDDIDMRISHVIRGEDHFVNTVKQNLLYAALGCERPVYAHLPLILGSDGKKLSKRVAQTDLLAYRERGVPARALVNFFTRLGWGFDAERDIFSMEEAVERFDLCAVSKGGAVLDDEKLAWMSGVYIREMSVAELYDESLPHILRAGLVTRDEYLASRAWFENVLACEQERVRALGELPERIAYLFADAPTYEAKAEKNLRKSGDCAALLAAWAASLGGQRLPPSRPDRPVEADVDVRLGTASWDTVTDPVFDPPAKIEARARVLAEERGVGFGKLVHPIRAALTGRAAGPSLFDIVYLLGRSEVEKRVARAIAYLERA